MSPNETEEFIMQEMQNIKANIDMFYLVIMGLFVFTLQPAFGLFEMGMVRRKNVLSVSFRKYISIVIGILAYFTTGYALCFGEGNGFLGTEYFGLIGLPDDQLAVVFFQYTFAATAATIPSGPVHERCTMTAYLCYTTLIAGFVYPMATHWTGTSRGWLKLLGFDDFAFSGVVHALGGAASLAAAYMAGPRKDIFLPDGKTAREIPSHSIAFSTCGAHFFFFAIIAFNGGSQMAISNTDDGITVAKIILNTIICICTSSLTGLFYERFLVERSANGWNHNNAIAGSFVGMVVICAGCNQFRFWGSILTGFISYFAYVGVHTLVLKMKIDDPVDGISIHISAGYFGLISTPLFKEDGLILNPSAANAIGLFVNAMGGIVILVWSFVNVCLLYVVLRYFNVHRSSPSDEQNGLDWAIHKELAYNFSDFEKSNEKIDKLAVTRPALAGFRRRQIRHASFIHVMPLE